MKRLVQHLIKTNLDEILEKSLLHCHAINVHSVMLLCSPGKTIRLFIGVPGHSLYRNTERQALSVGFHAHHCEVTLATHIGTVLNWRIQRIENGPIDLWRYRYESAITTGKPSFVQDREITAETLSDATIKPGHLEYMTASDLHTIYVPQDELAAWFVFEGREDASYDPATYSNADLEAFDFSNLYKKPSHLDVVSLLKLCDLL